MRISDWSSDVCSSDLAVVAQEVRSLAQRSAEASHDIKQRIQNSNAKVRHGGELVQKAGGTLDEIVVSVKKVADIVAEISSASREQRSEERRVGKECVSTCRSRWSP